MNSCFVLCVMLLFSHFLSGQPANNPAFSGNPIFPGWYADPEGIIFKNKYWIYPTYSAPFDQQVFFDAFSSPDLVHWTKHERILDTASVTWATRAMWRRPSSRKTEDILFSLVQMMYMKMRLAELVLLSPTIQPGHFVITWENHSSEKFIMARSPSINSYSRTRINIT